MSAPVVRIDRCRSCDASIVWMVTAAGKRMPVDADSVDEAELDHVGADPLFDSHAGHVSHFSTCPHAFEHRRNRR